MIVRTVPLAVLALLLAGRAAAQPAAVVPPPVATPVRVAVRTSVGSFVIAADVAHAPITAGNFLRYVDQHRLDGTSFYRALNLAPGVGLIQGGTKGDPRRSLKPIAHEPTSLTGLIHDDGAVSMARGAPGSASGDFFVIIGAIPSLDAGAADPGYAVFGHVVEGMDVVRAILGQPVSPTAGDGAMKGQMLAAPVTVVSARRQP